MTYRYGTIATDVINILDSVYRLKLKIHRVSETDLSLSSRMRGRGETYSSRPCLSRVPYCEALLVILARTYEECSKYEPRLVFFIPPFGDVKQELLSASTYKQIWIEKLIYNIQSGPVVIQVIVLLTSAFPSRCDAHIGL
jgi:hypothetical protein